MADKEGLAVIRAHLERTYGPPVSGAPLSLDAVRAGGAFLAHVSSALCRRDAMREAFPDMPEHYASGVWERYCREGVWTLWYGLDNGNRERLYAWVCERHVFFPSLADTQHALDAFACASGALRDRAVMATVFPQASEATVERVWDRLMHRGVVDFWTNLGPRNQAQVYTWYTLERARQILLQ